MDYPLEKRAKEAKRAKEGEATKESRGAPGILKKDAKRGTGAKILRAAYKADFTKTIEAQEWDSQYKEKVQKKPGNHVFHRLAKKRDWPQDMQWTDNQIKQFLDWALKRHHNLLELKDGDNYTPLHLALMNGNTAFVEAVLENTNLVNFRNVLPLDCQYGNALHIAIKFRHQTELVDLIAVKCATMKGMFTQGQPQTNNTPLHVCMGVDVENEGEGVDSDSDDDVDSVEDTRSRSYKEHDEADVINEDDQHRVAMDQDWVPVKTTEAMRKPVGFEIRPLTVEGRRPSQTMALPRKQSIAPPPAVSFELDTASNSLLQVVQLLVRKHDSVLSHKNAQQRTPYQERIHQLEQKHGHSRELKSIKAKDPIAKYIKDYCVRNFSRDEITRCLYQPGQERHIEFDLAGLPHTTISKDYLDRLSKHLLFESILKYVALPRLTMETDVVRKKKQTNPTPRKRGLSDLVAVFDWLRENGVEKIVKVMVIDDEDPSHSDTSIVEALKDFDIEIWNWKRLDLSTEVIRKSTNFVKEICLYSTGNNAVLMGWASEEGLANKKKFPNLEVVNLFIREGLEDDGQRQEYIGAFKERIESKTYGKVKVNSVLDNKAVSYASGFKDSESILQLENQWIDCVVIFSRLLRRAPNAERTPPIKIAIIDDGVDMSLHSLDDKIAIGKSFCPYANSADLINPYYVPSGNHGTYMASLICKTCPKVSLYVARLDERQTIGNGRRQITAKSAADAVQWAVDCGVDIISMSWSIETPLKGNKDMESFEAAVKDASLNKIIMFCSTSDQGSSTKDYCYPGDFDSCIKIGGATETGEALAWVDTTKVDFLLPGKNVPFTNDEGKITSYESGSSVATAAAAGLAGLLIFCSRLLSKSEDGSSLQDKTNMYGAFKYMANKGMFPDVKDFFETRFKRELARAEKPGNERLSDNRYDLSKKEWDSNCDVALEQALLRDIQ